MKEATRKFAENFLSKCENRTVNENWTDIRDHLSTMMEKFILSKL